MTFKIQSDLQFERFKNFQDGWYDEDLESKAFSPSFLKEIKPLIEDFVEKLKDYGEPILCPYLPNSIDIHWPQWLPLDMLINVTEDMKATYSIDLKNKNIMGEGTWEEITTKILLLINANKTSEK
jgi:hypothetical protein